MEEAKNLVRHRFEVEKKTAIASTINTSKVKLKITRTDFNELLLTFQPSYIFLARRKNASLSKVILADDIS